MPKVMVCGRGGSGKSTLVSLLAHRLSERARVLVVDADESNFGLNTMIGLEPPVKTVMDFLGGKSAVREKLMMWLRSGGDEKMQIFREGLSLESLPEVFLSAKANLSLVRIGKIEHSMEGCACPMGAVARSFLETLTVDKGEWVLIDTEAGIEHFGRGVLEGVDYVLVVVDPSKEAVLLADKACRMSKEAGKDWGVVLNKVENKITDILEGKLEQLGLSPLGHVPYSDRIVAQNLEGEPIGDKRIWDELDRILSNIESQIRSRAGPGEHGVIS